MCNTPIYIYPSAINIFSDQLFLTSLYENGLYCIKSNKESLKYLEKFNWENESLEYELYSDIVIYKGKMIFVPFNAKHIGIYDLNNKKLEKIDLLGKNSSLNGKYLRGIIREKYLYFIPYREKSILIFDCEKEELVERYELNNLSPKDFLDDGSFYYGTPVLEGDIIFFPLVNSNALLLFNIVIKKSKRIVLKDINCGISCISVSGDYIFVVDCDGVLYQLNYEYKIEKKVNLFTYFSIELKEYKYKISNCFCTEEAFVITSENNQFVLQIGIDGQGLNFEKFHLKRKKCENNRLYQNLWSIQEEDKIIVYDFKKNEKYKYKISVSNKRELIVRRLEEKANLFIERCQNYLSLNDMIEYERENSIEKQKQYKLGTKEVGKEIYKMIGQ